MASPDLQVPITHVHTDTCKHTCNSVLEHILNLNLKAIGVGNIHFPSRIKVGLVSELKYDTVLHQSKCVRRRRESSVQEDGVQLQSE